MSKITYGCFNGLIDWKANIPAGRANIKVHFSGGAMTRYGITPAEFTTDNVFFQKVIENSTHFHNGTIRVLRRYDDDTPASAPASESQFVTTHSDLKPDETPEPEDVTEVAVGCLQDAQDYLRDNFEIPTYKVTGKSKADTFAAANGVRFRWE